jgi:hypothetical protein
LRVIKEIKAMSVLLVILLLLCSAILGALVSYMWVMSSYYNMPEDLTLLTVEDVNFPVSNFSYFNLTVLNPSNSASDVNISAFRLTVEQTNATYDINQTEYPQPLPFTLARGTSQTFKCLANWGLLAGYTVQVEPETANASIKSFPYVLPSENLTIIPTFDPTVSVEYFNLTATNSPNSVANLTVSEVTLFSESVNVTPALPYVLQPNQTQVFKCERNWEDQIGLNVTISMSTLEGYVAVCITTPLPVVILSMDEPKFDYADTKHFSVTVHNSADATAVATLSSVNLTAANETISLNTSPPFNILPITVPPNQSLAVQCAWDWSAQRNETITVNVFTKEGFTVPNRTAITPAAVVWNITDVTFDLRDTAHFMVNVTNMPCSLDAINITQILLDGNETVLDQPFAVLANGTQAMFNCTFDWASLRGVNASITVITADGSSISTTVAIPSVGLNLLEDHFVFGEFHDPVTNFTIPYFNATVSNSINSLPDNVTITTIVLQIGNQTYEIDSDITNPIVGQHGYALRKGETVTFMCLFNWPRYLTQNPVTATVYTAEGFQVSKTWQPSY